MKLLLRQSIFQPVKNQVANMTSMFSTASMILVPLVLAIAASASAAKSAASTTELPGKSVILIPFIAGCSSSLDHFGSGYRLVQGTHLFFF